MNKQKKSIYLILAIIIVTTITIIMSINFVISYTKTKDEIITNMKDSSKDTIISLKNNVTDLIASYEINSYKKLINNEMKRKDIFAIIVNDYNMGNIMGKESYINGKIKNSDNNIIDFNPLNKEHIQNLNNCYFNDTYDIVLDGKILGNITIYISDKNMNRELEKIIFENLRNTISISFLLILVLFFFIRLFILKPISDIIDVITISDEDGIPTKNIPINNSIKEINLLANNLSDMITSIKISRDILEKSENRLKYLLELSPVAVRIAKNKGADVIFANNAYSDLIHVKKGELIHKNPKEYYKDPLVYEEIIHKLNKNDSIYHKSVELNIDGKEVWALASYINIQFDGEDSIIGWFYDITNEKNNEKSLYEAVELQTTIFDNSGYLIIRTDKNGIIKQINKEVTKLLNYKAEELLDKCTPEIIHLESEIKQKAKEFSEELNIKVNTGFEVIIIKSNLSKENEHEWTYITKDGKHIPVILSVSALRDKDNNIYGYLGIARDISQQKLIESQAKLASMGEMIGNIAHQWRQPLNVISTIASSIKLKNDYGLIEINDILVDMNNIMKQTQYLSNTIDDFRNFIKNSNQLTEISIKETIEKVISISNSSIKSSNINLIVDIEEDMNIEGYQNQLIQAIINIINNSKDAMEENNIENRFIFITTKKIKDDLFLIIKDNGGGINLNIIDKIFEPYFTTKHKSIGTGIGLAMVHQIITKHHNSLIEVRNETYTYEEKKYTGACFKIIFKIN
uniref:PAS domain-containing sensor histidine kinase n=3 Tax=Aliarcobacter sp. TaxID=2321116 RepID=UPI0040477111